jgi:hypothetical protein
MSSLEETYSPFARTLKTSGTRWLSTSVITKRLGAISKRYVNTGIQEQTATYRYICRRSNNDGREYSC